MIFGYLKGGLKWLRLYHPLQSFYRISIFAFKNKKYRRLFLKYAGEGFTCNVCAAEYKKFVPHYPAPINNKAIQANQVIAGYGENIICPNCMSTARERLVIAFLSEDFFLDGKKILHLSPEKNIYSFLKTKAIVTTADLHPGYYKTIDKKITKEDATHFSFDDDSFDIVIANHILEHIPDDKGAMKEILRVMKPGAKAVLQVPYSETLVYTIEELTLQNPAKQSELYGQKDHIRIYALTDYISRLKAAGFSIEVLGKAELKRFLKFAIQPEEKLLKLSKPST
ncbi:MAG: class I SAM-dependent methyltransferase [Ferruginibacter sp.]